MLPTMAGRGRKVLFLEPFKTAHRHLKLETRFKILIEDCDFEDFDWELYYKTHKEN